MSAAVTSTVSTSLTNHTDTRNSTPMDAKKAGLDEGECCASLRKNCFDPSFCARGTLVPPMPQTPEYLLYLALPYFIIDP